jgi:hypothetical protein
MFLHMWGFVVGHDLIGKDIVFRFIIKYYSLIDIGPLGSKSIFI